MGNVSVQKWLRIVSIAIHHLIVVERRSVTAREFKQHFELNVCFLKHVQYDTERFEIYLTV